MVIEANSYAAALHGLETFSQMVSFEFDDEAAAAAAESDEDNEDNEGEEGEE